MLDKPWWELWPGRLEFELKALESAGIKWEKDEAVLKRDKIMRIRLAFPLRDSSIILFANFPPQYPYFRPEVFAEPGSFSRHQNPIEGNLCLLGRRTQNWDSDCTLAQLLTSQFPLLERAARTTNQIEREALEEQLGEPVTTFFPCAADSMILIDSAKRIPPEHNAGGLTIRVQVEPIPIIRGDVIHVRAKDGKKLLSFDVCHADGNELPGSWVRLSEIPFDKKMPQEFENELVHKGIIPRAKFTYRVGQWFVDIVGLVVAEELQQGEHGDGWMFLVRLKQDKTQVQRTELVRAGRAGRTDFAVRIPALEFLRDKQVAVIGLGSVGAPIAIELARSGVGKIILIDFDFIEPGSTVRWPLGRSVFGMQKSVALGQFIQSNYPFTRLEPFEYRFGTIYTSDFNSRLEKVLANVDLVIDATAELAIHQLLSDFARANKKPFIYAYITPGGLGGLVARIDPKKEMGCWHCLQIALRNTKSIPEPPYLEKADVQPVGCAERTSIFPGFDAQEVSLEATRMAISALSDGTAKQYPKSDWDIAIVKFRSDTGENSVPIWSTYSLAKEETCPLCR